NIQACFQFDRQALRATQCQRGLYVVKVFFADNSIMNPPAIIAGMLLDQYSISSVGFCPLNISRKKRALADKQNIRTNADL
ncbi:MAG TPA: hypothetical protein PLM48_08330, partial [Clostridia bacterium]|nr:hypothetical protein [Clostridia bacterium]